MIHADNFVYFNVLPIRDPLFFTAFLPGFLLMTWVSMNDKLLDRKKKEK